MQIQHRNKSNKHPLITRMLFLALTLLMCITPLKVYADYESTEVEAEYSDGTYTSSNGAWYATYAENAGYKGQGVLLYLLERNGGGAVAGTSPKAYACGEEMESYELHAQDKYNRYPEVTKWEGTDPYWGGEVANYGGFMKDSLSSNVSDIKSWLKTPYDGNSTQGIWMVKSIWGPAIAERFVKEEVILIAEPIVGIQFAQYYKSKALNDFSREMPIDDMISTLKFFKENVPNLGDTAISYDLSCLIDYWLEELEYAKNTTFGYYTEAAKHWAVEDCCDALAELVIDTNIYFLLGDPYAGTPKKLIEHYSSLEPTLDKEQPALVASLIMRGIQIQKAQTGMAYYKRSANAATYINSASIICQNANFNLWPANQSARIWHSESNVNTYSIGMLAMCAWTDDVGGNINIYKVYQDKSGNHVQTITTTGTTPYPASNEGKYKLIEWETSTVKPATDPDSSVPWSNLISDKPVVQHSTTPSTITPGATEKAIYLLYQETTTPITPPVSGDWLLSIKYL